MHEGIQSLPNTGTVKLLAVVVLYNQKPDDSITLNSLRETVSRLRNGEADVKILAYDNTPGGQDPGTLPSEVLYNADTENGGLAEAYNYALELAHESSYNWLLTLDQDTNLPIDFISKLCNIIRHVTPLSDVAAIVPSITSDGRLISPSVPKFYWAFTKHFPDNFTGVSPHKLTLAVNSASTLRVSAVRAVGGYDPRFWLDYCDVLMFYRLQTNHQRVFVSGDIHVEHEASVLDLMNRTTPSRYANIYLASEAFFDEYMGFIERGVQVAKTFYQLCRLLMDGVAAPYLKVVLRSLYRRLRYSRRHRMECWNRIAGLRLTRNDVTLEQEYLNAES